MDWNVAQTLLSIMEQRGLMAGARALRIDPATARRRLESLPGNIAQSVLDPGRGASPMATKLAAIAERARRHAEGRSHDGSDGSSRRIDGAVTLTAGELLASSVLPPVFAGLRHLHPHLRLRLRAGAFADDLLRGEADVAVRLFRPEQKALIVRAVGAATLGLWARRDYANREGLPLTFDDLDRFRLIGAIEDSAPLRALRAAGYELPQRSLFLRTNHFNAQFAAAEAGLGITLSFNLVAGATPTMVRVLPEVEASMPIFVAMHEDQRSSIVVRTVFDAVVGAFRRLPAPKAAGEA